MDEIILFIASVWIGVAIGGIIGFIFGYKYQRSGKIPMVDKIAQKMENIIREKAVFAEGITPKEMEKIRNDEKGWGNLINGLKGPAEGVDS